jgi:hypothetical protein
MNPNDPNFQQFLSGIPGMQANMGNMNAQGFGQGAPQQPR